jgi:predicted amidohydrolase YtcJ
MEPQLVCLSRPSVRRRFSWKRYIPQVHLPSITISGARFLRPQRQISFLEVHELADFIVLEKRFFKVPANELGHQKVLLGMVGDGAYSGMQKVGSRLKYRFG